MLRLRWMSLGAALFALAACAKAPDIVGVDLCTASCVDPNPQVQLNGTLELAGLDVILHSENDLVRLLNVRADIAQQLDGEEVVATGRWQHADFYVTDLHKDMQAPQKPDSLLLRRW